MDILEVSKRPPHVRYGELVSQRLRSAMLRAQLDSAGLAAAARGYQHPALHLRELSPHGMFASFADQLEQIWQTVTPYPAESG